MSGSLLIECSTMGTLRALGVDEQTLAYCRAGVGRGFFDWELVQDRFLSAALALGSPLPESTVLRVWRDLICPDTRP